MYLCIKKSIESINRKYISLKLSWGNGLEITFFYHITSLPSNPLQLLSGHLSPEPHHLSSPFPYFPPTLPISFLAIAFPLLFRATYFSLDFSNEILQLPLLHLIKTVVYIFFLKCLK